MTRTAPRQATDAAPGPYPEPGSQECGDTGTQECGDTEEELRSKAAKGDTASLLGTGTGTGDEGWGGSGQVTEGTFQAKEMQVNGRKDT